MKFLTRDVVNRAHLLDDEVLADLPLITTHDRPQDSPQEYECGCVAITRITDRDAQRGELPFEMRLAIPCGKGFECVVPSLAICSHENRVHYLGGGIYVCFKCWAQLLFGRRA